MCNCGKGINCCSVKKKQKLAVQVLEVCPYCESIRQISGVCSYCGYCPGVDSSELCALCDMSEKCMAKEALLLQDLESLEGVDGFGI